MVLRAHPSAVLCANHIHGTPHSQGEEIIKAAIAVDTFDPLDRGTYPQLQLQLYP